MTSQSLFVRTDESIQNILRLLEMGRKETEERERPKRLEAAYRSMMRSIPPVVQGKQDRPLIQLGFRRQVVAWWRGLKPYPFL